MKRTDTLTNLISILLFAALVAYVGAHALRTARASDVTAEAVAVDFSLGGTASGIVIREETVLTSAAPYVDIAAKEGTRVACGGLVATALGSEEGLERAGRAHELEREIARISDALRFRTGSDDPAKRDETLRRSVSDLCAAVARHETQALDTAALNLTSLLLPDSGGAVSEAELSRLQSELDRLNSGAAGDTAALYADAAGIFSAAVDGYEHLRISDAENLTPSGLNALIGRGGSADEHAYGKLVTGFDWYFAAAMDETEAAQLTPGGRATLNFGRYCSRDISAEVYRLGPAEDGRVTVIFRCNTALADTMALRSATATVVFASYSGLRIPAEAVQADGETGIPFVWCVTAMQLERKNIEILYRGTDFVIAAVTADADGLRSGNKIVVSGEDLYEGKVFTS